MCTDEHGQRVMTQYKQNFMYLQALHDGLTQKSVA